MKKSTKIAIGVGTAVAALTAGVIKLMMSAKESTNENNDANFIGDDSDDSIIEVED